jgi:transcriptional antiterminator RfaH
MRDHIAARSPRVHERRARVTVTMPLFPSYLFVSVNASGQWFEANRCPCVLHIIRVGGVPALMRDETIAEIRARELDGVVELPDRQLRPGAPIRVINGPLTGLTGLVAGMNGHERIGVLLSLLGAERRVEIPRNHIEVVSGPRL